MTELIANLLRRRSNLDRPPDFKNADPVKALVVCDTATAISLSLNMSSVTDNGIGNYSPRYVVGFTGSYHCPTLAGTDYHTVAGGWTSSTASIQTYNSAHNLVDAWFSLHACGAFVA